MLGECVNPRVREGLGLDHDQDGLAQLRQSVQGAVRAARAVRVDRDFPLPCCPASSVVVQTTCSLQPFRIGLTGKWWETGRA